MPQSAFTAFRALLPFENYSAEWSGWVWQPSADSNGRLVLHYRQQRAITLNPQSWNFKQKGRQTAITICRGLSHRTGRAALPSHKISGFFSRVEKPFDDINSHLFLMNKKGLIHLLCRVKLKIISLNYSLNAQIQMYGKSVNDSCSLTNNSFKNIYSNMYKKYYIFMEMCKFKQLLIRKKFYTQTWGKVT